MDRISQSRSSLGSPGLPSSPVNAFEHPKSPASDAATWNRSCSRARSISYLNFEPALSASELASSDYFDEWRRGTVFTVPLSVGGGSRWDAFPVPQTVRNLGNYLLDVRLPEWIFENNSRTRAAPLPGVRLVDMFVEEDAALKTSLERIEEESSELARLHSQQTQPGLNWRIPVDVMIRKAFVKPRSLPNVPNPAECDFICDLAFYMPHSSVPMNIDKTVIADTVIATSLYPSPSMFNLHSQIFEELRVDKERHDSPVVCVPHLIVKYKNGPGTSALNEATNELHFLVGAAMHQRRLLGFEREPVFAIASSAGKARAFASYWKDNQIQIIRLYAEDFDLQVTEQACLFFLLLLRVRHHVTAFASQLEILDGSTVQERIKASERSWKADPTYPPPPGTSWPSPPRSRASSPLSMTPSPPSPGWSSASTDSSAPEEEMDVDDGLGSSTSVNENLTGLGIAKFT